MGLRRILDILPLLSIKTDPKDSQDLVLDDTISQVISIVHGWDGNGLRIIRSTSSGELQVAVPSLNNLTLIGTSAIGSAAWVDLGLVVDVWRIYGQITGTVNAIVSFSSDGAAIGMQWSLTPGALDGIPPGNLKCSETIHASYRYIKFPNWQAGDTIWVGSYQYKQQ